MRHPRHKNCQSGKGDIINDNGKALSYKFCSDSEIALKHDMVVAKYYEKLSGLYEDDYLAVLNEILPK